MTEDGTGLGLLPGTSYARRFGMGTAAISGDAPYGRDLLWLPGNAAGLRWPLLREIGKPGSGTGPLNRGLSYSLSVLPGGFVSPLLWAWNRGRYTGMLRAAGFFCISLGARRASAGIR